MFERFSNTWELMGASWNVLKRDKAMILFPLLSGISCIVVLASFIVPVYMISQNPPPEGSVQEKIAHYGLAFAFYFVNYFVITFFNVGITACAVSRMAGGEPTFGGGIREAFKRIHLIAGWALVSATVGVILKAISERSNLLGKIVVAILGATWTITTFLVVPILVVEDMGPIAAAKRSAALLRKSWGDQVRGNFSFGVIFTLLALPGIGLIVASFLLGFAAHSLMLGMMLLGLGVVYLVLLSLVQSALMSIFQAAVYMHTQGVRDATGGFPVKLLKGALV